MMKVAFINPNEPVEKEPHRCSVCKLTFGWREESSYYERGVGIDFRGFDAQFILCSEKCHEKAKAQGLIDKYFNDLHKFLSK